MYAGSRCWDSTRTDTVGCRRRISTAARSPSSRFPGGIRTSTIATSGTYERTLSMRSGASLARPTTSSPASLSSAAMPSRRSASSSATTMRSGAASPSLRRSSVGVTSAGAGNAEPDRGGSADARELRRVEHAVARILAETERPVEVYEATLEAIGRGLGWRLGVVWGLDAADGLLRCVGAWHATEPAEEFEALSRSLAFAAGEGLSGPVLGRGGPPRGVHAPPKGNLPPPPPAP